ncbi:MAG TPA: hypothetical protein VHC44_07465 [Verrucomicrobiae bacterium]|nr:hypothetical protein [Verrucomicrobiae bacterium]
MMKSLLGCSLLFLAILTVRAGDYSQMPGHFGAFGSEENLAVADEFVLSQDTKIRQINWWGDNMPKPAKNFKIRLFSDNEGQPGTLLLETDRASILKRKTGDFLIRGEGRDDPDLYPEFQYTLVLRHPFAAKAGVKYWLSVLSEIGDQWTWEMSGSEQNPGVQRSLYGDPINGPWTPFDYNTAFVIGPVPKQRLGKPIRR